MVKLKKDVTRTPSQWVKAVEFVPVSSKYYNKKLFYYWYSSYSEAGYYRCLVVVTLHLCCPRAKMYMGLTVNKKTPW